MKKLDIDTIIMIALIILGIITSIIAIWSIIYRIMYCQKYIYAPIAEVPTICIVR